MDERQQAALAGAYLEAKWVVLQSKYAIEVVATGVSPDAISESAFLRELAWVVLSAGMAERVVRLKFSAISDSFLSWSSAAEIADCADICVSSALKHFGHDGKIWAIAAAAALIAEVPFGLLREKILANPLEELQRFSYIGPKTAFHLAKNMGIPFSKPDRHLTRLSNAAGFKEVGEFCDCISSFVGDDIRKVDTVLWRFATLNRDYLRQFQNHLKEPS